MKLEEVIKVKNLSFIYPDGRNALQDISLNIYKNEQVAIVGPNGAGKTTLLLHLIGILKGKGEINILGMEMNNGSLKKIRSKVGLVSQDPNDQLFTPTIFEDVAFGPLNLGYPKETISQKVKESLKKVGMEGFEDKSPHHLSFGEKKKVSLATVLSMSPEILLLDEPTSNLDPHSRREFIELIRNIPATKVIATHDLEMVLELTNKVIVLKNGKKIVEGETRELLSNKKIMEENGLEVPISLKAKI